MADDTRYFLYSTSQHKLRTEVDLKIGKEYVPGKVLVNGKWKMFTELSSTASNNRFADATVVTSGTLDSIKYTLPTTKWRTR